MNKIRSGDTPLLSFYIVIDYIPKAEMFCVKSQSKATIKKSMDKIIDTPAENLPLPLRVSDLTKPIIPSVRPTPAPKIKAKTKRKFPPASIFIAS